jgi:hypothetical protein
MRENFFKFVRIIIIAIGMAQLSKFASSQEVKNKPIPPEVRFVAAGIESARQGLDCAQATVDYSEQTSKEYFQELAKRFPSVYGKFVNNDQGKHAISQWGIRDGRQFLTTKFESGEEDQSIVKENIVSDSISVKTLWTGFDKKRKAPGNYYIGLIQYNSDAITNGIFNEEVNLDPREFVYYSAFTPLDELFLNPKFAAQFKGYETVEGSRCMVIEVSPLKDMPLIFWIDMDHGYMARQVKSYVIYSNVSLLRSEIRVPIIMKGQSHWFPGVVEFKSFATAKQEDPHQDMWNTKAPVAYQKITISNFKDSCPDENQFYLKWPDGTQVQDNITDKVFYSDKNMPEASK